MSHAPFVSPTYFRSLKGTFFWRVTTPLKSDATVSVHVILGMINMLVHCHSCLTSRARGMTPVFSTISRGPHPVLSYGAL